MTAKNNPFNVQLRDVAIRKFNGTDYMSIMPQVAEFTLYQSVFENTIKADLVINDFIGLMENYPLSAEEVVEVTVSQELADQGDATKYMYFVITSIKDISISDDARQTTYVIEMASLQAFESVKGRVSHAYYDTIEDMISKIYSTYLVRSVSNPKPLNILETTKKIRKLIIPNLKPLDAISWLCKFAVSSEPQKYYTPAFFETLENFTFKALQKPTYQGTEDAEAYIKAGQNKYLYISNIELATNDPSFMEGMNSRNGGGYSVDRLINEIKINKRYSGLEKILGGYFENELVEVNMLQKDHKVTYTDLKYNDPNFTTIRSQTPYYPLNTTYNTESYIDHVKNEYVNPETSSRVRYIINNFDDANQPSFRDKFGNSSRSFLAHQQVDISLSVFSDLRMRPGDLFHLTLPQTHGFNYNDFDTYLSGFYIVSEIKTVMLQGGRTQTYLRVNRDSFEIPLEEKSRFKMEGGPSPFQQSSSSTRLGPR